MRTLCLTLLLLFLVGCGEGREGPRDFGEINKTFDIDATTVTMIWTNPERVDEICGFAFDVNACSFASEDGGCTIVMPPFRGYDDEHLMWLLGHEFSHCLWGSWHDF